jgi:DNA-binding transcriptional ArsR family regulator
MVPWARSLLHAWLPLYEKIEGRVGRMLVRDVAARQSDEATSDPIGFVERTTNGIRLILEPTVRRIVLAPSYFGRPFNSLTRLGEIQLISYPIADSSLGERAGATPPAATLRLFRALGDETRLRILRLVSEQPRYLTELANELELSKPTVSHHMAQLRSAGLVTTTEQGNLTYYTLRQDRIVEAGPELGLYLKGK